MARTTTRTRSFRLEVVEVEHEFTDDEPPSLGAMPVYETTGEDITHVRAAGLRKCGLLATAERKRGAK